MNKRARSLITGLVILVVVVAAGWLAYTQTSLFGHNTVIKDSGSNISDFSAVFLTNGQVYFGKIYELDNNVVDLRDIYYLQVNSSTSLQSGTSSTSTGTTANPQISLVKLGNELHGPNDRMLITKSQVLFTESLKNDSKVVSAINNYVAGK